MSSGSNRRALVATAFFGFVVGLGVSLRYDLFPESQALNLFGGEDNKTVAPAPPVVIPDFADLSEHISPSVVNISSTQEVKSRTPFGQGGPNGGGGGGGGGAPGAPGAPGGEEGDPFQDFYGPFEKFFGQPRRPYKAKSLGSGFVIDSNGFILTNNHVVENADEIIVKLSNGKEFKAKVVGRDAKTDIALIEIKGDAKDLPAVRLGDSNKLRVGEWVVAIGNPFGLENTVTAGIVSAIGRHINQGPYDNFIQTDAAINPGNSGGPLLNTKGEVIGINTAIFSRGGGNIGIGFAIPIDLATEIVPQLKDKGRVTRGWLGVMIQKVTPDIAESLGLDETKGALVADVVKEGPAEAAGLKQGDVIVEYDGKPVTDSAELPLLVARTPVGKSVPVKAIRDKKVDTFTVTIAELKDEEDPTQATGGESEDLGLAMQTLTPDLAENLGLERTLKGVVVTQVEPGGPAAEAGMRRGDVILEVNRAPVKDVAAYRKALKDAGAGKSVLFLVRRGDNTIFLAIKPAS
ncbi:MAG TPA: DegQ family serine endoprotease [Candidatus Binatia bacterium]|jgi:serine protease Do|nr:DegQ family serine endoprotease [Candidatus Binatia bacterium]